jgi:predicted alpha/beta-hydrolase family hydrolase
MDHDVPTTLGPGRLVVNAAHDPRAVLWMGHGAGGGIEAADLVALAASLPSLGITVVRYEQPWRVAGRKIAPRPAALDVGWMDVASHVAEIAAGRPLIVGGRSAGARVACRTADAVGAVAVVCLAFPLHPPGKPEKSRIDELLRPAVPVLVLQGERDTFGNAEDVSSEIASALADAATVVSTRDIRVINVPGGDHSMAVLKSSSLDASGVARLVVETVNGFIDEVV